MSGTIKRIKTLNAADFFATMLAAVDNVLKEPAALLVSRNKVLIKKLNRMIKMGCVFKVSENDFITLSDQVLTEEDNGFLSINKDLLLPVLQTGILKKNLFNNLPDQLIDFTVDIAERESILTEEDTIISYEAHQEAVREVTAIWFAELLEKQ